MDIYIEKKKKKKKKCKKAHEFGLHTSIFRRERKRERFTLHENKQPLLSPNIYIFNSFNN